MGGIKCYSLQSLKLNAINTFLFFLVYNITESVCISLFYVTEYYLTITCIIYIVTEHVKTTDVWIKVFVVSCTKWIINKLNEISFDYRTVAKQIDEEQTTVKKEIRVC